MPGHGAVRVAGADTVLGAAAAVSERIKLGKCADQDNFVSFVIKTDGASVGWACGSTCWPVWCWATNRGHYMLGQIVDEIQAPERAMEEVVGEHTVGTMVPVRTRVYVRTYIRTGVPWYYDVMSQLSDWKRAHTCTARTRVSTLCFPRNGHTMAIQW
jgi:hypothetical protein